MIIEASFLSVINLPDIRQEFPVKDLAPNRHLERVEGVLHDVVGVQVVNPPHGHVDVCLRRVREEQELGPGHGAEALQAEVLRLHDLEARGGLGPERRAVGVPRRGLFNGVQTGGDGVYTGLYLIHVVRFCRPGHCVFVCRDKGGEGN